MNLSRKKHNSVYVWVCGCVCLCVCMIDTLYIRTNKNLYCPSHFNLFPITGKHTWFRQIKSTIVFTVYIIIKKTKNT